MSFLDSLPQSEPSPDYSRNLSPNPVPGPQYGAKATRVSLSERVNEVGSRLSLKPEPEPEPKPKPDSQSKPKPDSQSKSGVGTRTDPTTLD